MVLSFAFSCCLFKLLVALMYVLMLLFVLVWFTLLSGCDCDLVVVLLLSFVSSLLCWVLLLVGCWLIAALLLVCLFWFVICLLVCLLRLCLGRAAGLFCC